MFASAPVIPWMPATPCPVAAAASWIDLKAVTILSWATPNEASCCAPSMNAALGNGLVLAKSSSWLISSLALPASPRIDVNAPRADWASA